MGDPGAGGGVTSPWAGSPVGRLGSFDWGGIVLACCSMPSVGGVASFWLRIFVERDPQVVRDAIDGIVDAVSPAAAVIPQMGVSHRGV